MPHFVRTPQANEDLLQIWAYIARDSVEAADRMLLKIDRKCRFLAANPHTGELLEQFRPGLRRFVVDNYLVFYQLIDGGIEVFRVLHGARDIEKLL